MIWAIRKDLEGWCLQYTTTYRTRRRPSDGNILYVLVAQLESGTKRRSSQLKTESKARTKLLKLHALSIALHGCENLDYTKRWRLRIPKCGATRDVWNIMRGDSDKRTSLGNDERKTKLMEMRRRVGGAPKTSVIEAGMRDINCTARQRFEYLQRKRM